MSVKAYSFVYNNDANIGESSNGAIKNLLT